VIERYTRPAMGSIWTEDTKYRCWLQVESAASTVLAEDGVIPKEAAEAIARIGVVSAARIQEIEAEVKHDVIAFTTAAAEAMKNQGLDGQSSRWLHYGLTSNDIVDTAQALQVKQASELIRTGIVAFLAVLKRRALEFKHTPTIGRTHGIHAEPTTFGLKLLNWYAEMERNLARFDAAAEDMRVGKLSGAVGTFGHLSPNQEEKVCEHLGLKPAPVATQVIQRDRRLHFYARHPRQYLGQDRRRSPPPAAHRGPRGTGVLQRKAEGLLRHAAQEEPDHVGTDQRPRPCPPRQRPGGL
jgi:adenylosuccinate lyase